jgi:hypothetical protein
MEEKKDIFDFIEKRPIETPDADYFKNLADTVIAKAADAPVKSEAKIIPLYRRPVFWLSSAAAAVLVAFLLLPENPNIIPTTIAGDPFQDLSKKEVLAYVDENIEDFDEDLLAEFIPVSQLDMNPMVDTETQESENPIETIIETETQELQESLESISQDEILQYLQEEGFDSEDEDDLFL